MTTRPWRCPTTNACRKGRVYRAYGASRRCVEGKYCEEARFEDVESVDGVHDASRRSLIRWSGGLVESMKSGERRAEQQPIGTVEELIDGDAEEEVKQS